MRLTAALRSGDKAVVTQVGWCRLTNAGNLELKDLRGDPTSLLTWRYRPAFVAVIVVQHNSTVSDVNIR